MSFRHFCLKSKTVQFFFYNRQKHMLCFFMCLSRSLSVCMCLFLCLYMCQCLCLRVYVFACVSKGRQPCLKSKTVQYSFRHFCLKSKSVPFFILNRQKHIICFFMCLGRSLSVCMCLFLCLYMCQCLCLRVYVCACVSKGRQLPCLSKIKNGTVQF